MVLEPLPDVPQGAFDPYASLWPRFVLVLDADALLSSVAHQCSRGYRPRLLRVLESNSCRGFAPDHVYGEAYKGLVKFANEATSLGKLRRCFEERYLPHIRWVDTSIETINDARVALVIEQDLTDVPTAQLASLIAPCLVVSGDKHLRRPGVAPAEWVAALGHGTEIVEGADQQDGLSTAVALPVALVLGGGAHLGKKLRIPWWVVASAAGAGGYAVLRDPDRRRTIATRSRPWLESFLEMLAQAYARQREGIAGLRELMFQPDGEPTPKQQIATVLARAPEPLLAADLHYELTRHFDLVPTLDEMRSTLRTSPEFTNPARYRWALGRVSEAWQGEL